MFRKNKLSFFILSFLFFCSTASIPSVSVFGFSLPKTSNLIILCLPLLLYFLGWLNFPKYIVGNKLIILLIFLLLSFTIVNYYQIVTNGIENRLFIAIGYASQINFMFWVGLFLNCPQISFFPLNFIFTNLSLFAGGIVWVFLSVGSQNHFALLGTPSFVILTREVKSFCRVI